MTPTDQDHRTPGARLLRVAQWIFEEPALSSIVHPAIADFEQELRAAGGSRTARAVARLHGYWAFAKLALVLVVSQPASAPNGAAAPTRSGGGTLFVLVAILFASTWPFFGWFMTAAVAGGALLAIAMRRWHDRHPAVLANVDPVTGMRRPEINLSAIPVSGNIGGLIFAVGSIAIVIVGLPELRWFLLAAIVSGVCAAGALLAWRRAHPSGMRPANSIVLR